MKKITAFFCSLIILSGIFTVTAADGVKTLPLSVCGKYGRSEAYELLPLINAEREKRGYFPLEWDSVLEKAAMRRAAEAAVKFSHTRPNQKPWYTADNDAVIKRFPTSGENLAAGSMSAREAMSGWMNSPGHRDNILNNNFTHVGAARAEINGVLYWVELFGGGDSGDGVRAGSKKRFTVRVKSAERATRFIIAKAESRWHDNFRRLSKLRAGKAKKIKLLAYDKNDVFIPAELNIKKFRLSSSDKKILRVSKKGRVRALKKGSAKITAVYTPDKKLKIRCKIRVI